MSKSEATLLLKIKTAGQEAIKGLEDSLDSLKNVALIGFAAISGAIVKSLADYRQQEAATNALTQAMVNNGIYSKQLKDEYLAQASALQKLSLYGDEQIISAQSSLQSMIGQKKVSQELMTAVLDLATAKKMDLNSAAELVGKTISSSTNILKRQGVEFDNNTTGAERLAAVTGALNAKFGGQAQAATSGLGAITQLSNAVSDISEALGERLAPYVTLVANALKSLAEDSKSTNSALDTFVGALELTAAVAIQAYGYIQQLGMFLGVYFAAYAEAAAQALSGNFSRAVDIVKMGLETIQEESVKISAETDAKLMALANVSQESKAAVLAKEEADLAQSLLNKKEMKAQMTEEEMARELEINQMKLDMQAAQDELERAQKDGNDARKLAAQIAIQDAILKSDADHKVKLAAQNEKARLQEQQREALSQQLKIAAQKDTFATIATLSNSNNHALAAIGKAAAITQIAIDTPVAISKALAAFPPPVNFVAAGVVGVAMAAQAAQIAGVPLAEGGIVQPRPGGIQATIGEAGQAEAVIPLDRADEFGLGGGGANVTVNVYGGLLGDERSAYELAIAIDKKLLEVRRNGESVAFDRIT